MSRIGVLLADDHAVLRAGLKSLLDAEDDLEVVGEAETARQAIELAAELRPDVVLMDITLPDDSGVEATRHIKQEHPNIQLLALTMHDDASYLRDFLDAGGSGYVLKQAASDELLAAIRTVNAGGSYLNPDHTRLLLDELLDRQDATGENVAQDRLDALSERERQVFKLVALGYRNSDIAEMLSLSVKTVETYRARLMQKLGLQTRADLVRLAVHLGVFDGNQTL